MIIYWGHIGLIQCYTEWLFFTDQKFCIHLSSKCEGIQIILDCKMTFLLMENSAAFHNTQPKRKVSETFYKNPYGIGNTTYNSPGLNQQPSDTVPQPSSVLGHSIDH